MKVIVGDWAMCTYVRKTFAATDKLALVGLFAGVGTDMHGQGTSLDKALLASGVVAGVWPRVCVDAVMSLQIRLAVEFLRFAIKKKKKNPRRLACCCLIE